ncbi:MAG: peptidase [Myxococcales bacterium]|nr:peptidase [Myxococcales bacterium]
MISETNARQLLDRVLLLARTNKGVEATAAVRIQRAGNTRFAVNEITSSADVERVTLSITAQVGQRSASTTTNQLDDRSIDDAVARAIRMARLAPETPEAMPPLGKQTYVHPKSALDPATAKLTPQARAKAIGEAISAGDAGHVVIAGFYEHEVSLVTLASTAGLSASHESSSCQMSCTARTTDATGSGWAGAGSNKVGDIDAAALAKVAVDKAIHSAKPQKLDPGRYTVVLEPAAVADLLAFLIGSLGARRADEHRSFFGKQGGGTRVGDKLFPDSITLRSDPSDVALGAAPFDGEGVALAPTKWIDKGVLTGLTYSRFWAKRQGKPPTGNPSGWSLDGGTASRDDLIKSVKRGVLVTRFWYLRDLDPQTLLATGLTRDGTFLIENGAVTVPVNNFRFNESPVQMLARCDGLGATTIPGGDTRVPVLRTNEFNLASISEAV